ncbi:hypothetical protein NBRC116592_31560 [Colwellia sp. KU-HH00111]|uniref:cytochrome P460 family protein n=1 Tax=Colwellia sp. KU-HH00111 TaxID=3127652 RepID=UPI0031082671
MKTYSKLKKTAATATLATLVTISSLSVSAQTDEKNDLDLVIDKAVSVFKSITGTEDVIVDENSFSCIREMTPVRHFYVDNLLGDIESTLEVANNPEGAIYPPGSVVQLVPTEVMVKRESGTFPATGDWEFFELEVDDKGTKIAKRGFVDVNNRFGGNCFSCHAPAREKWDFICESNHGCEPIPIDHKMTGALQRSDPRCGEEVLQDGDTMALIKLKTMVVIGSAKKWLEDLF